MCLRPRRSMNRISRIWGSKLDYARPRLFRVLDGTSHCSLAPTRCALRNLRVSQYSSSTKKNLTVFPFPGSSPSTINKKNNSQMGVILFADRTGLCFASHSLPLVRASHRLAVPPPIKVGGTSLRRSRPGATQAVGSLPCHKNKTLHVRSVLFLRTGRDSNPQPPP